jgi:hypothetical protein
VLTIPINASEVVKRTSHFQYPRTG